MSYLQAIILAIIEGLTEFLPVSSTGHMVIASSVMGIASDQFVKTFTVAIQLGAILSVIVLYYKKFIQSFTFYFKLFIAFIPSAIIGKLLNDKIDEWLETPLIVAFSFILGGIVLLFVDKWFSRNESEGNSEPNGQSAFKIGLFQCIAMIPGVSRSAATIIGGLTQKLTRKAAAEFSFFLAVPTMFAATGYKLFKFYKEEGGTFTGEQINLLLLGNIAAFIIAMIAIKSFIGFLTRYGFKVFGYYRIVLGIIIIILIYSGTELSFK